MKKSKYCVLFLLIAAICLIVTGAALAGSEEPPEGWCEQCWKDNPDGPCTGCKKEDSETTDDSSVDSVDFCSDCCSMVEKGYGAIVDCSLCDCRIGDKEDPTSVVIKNHPSDEIGEYYINDKSGKDYISFKNWHSCMQFIDDAFECAKIVTDPCEACLGFCLFNKFLGVSCSKECSGTCNAGTSN